MAALSELGLRVRTGLAMLDWRALAMRPGHCPLCGPTLFLRLSRDPLGARCARCAAWPVSMAMGVVFEQLVEDPARVRVYEASGRGPWVEFLSARSGELVRSEYWDEVPRGEFRDGVACEDLEALSFPAARFDVCTHTEVLEHVADDAAALRESWRVLVPGGWLIFTVPIFERAETVERAVRDPDGRVRHLLEPEYHDDLLRGQGRVLVFREYGADVVERLERAGFECAEVREVADPSGFGHAPRVVVARKPG